jgi:hypothetical protein
MWQFKKNLLKDKKNVRAVFSQIFSHKFSLLFLNKKNVFTFTPSREISREDENCVCDEK